MSDYIVEIARVTARPTAIARGVATSWPDFASRWKPMLDSVWSFLREKDLRTDGHNVMVYRNKVPNLEFEVGVEVSRSFESAGAIVSSHLPDGRAAHVTHTGDYAGLAGAHEAIARWCRVQGHTPAGTRWEVYGDTDPDPDKVQTDVYWLVED